MRRSACPRSSLRWPPMERRAVPDVLDVPVVLCLYNRPDVHCVFRAIRASRPKRLFVFADGPRADRPDDAVRTADARKQTAGVDWPGEVHRDYAPVNIGVKARVESALRFVFAEARCEAAIVFEDDCVPIPVFSASAPSCSPGMSRARRSRPFPAAGSPRRLTTAAATGSHDTRANGAGRHGAARGTCTTARWRPGRVSAPRRG